MPTIEEYRKFLKSDLWEQWASLMPDQQKGIPYPPLQKSAPADARRIELVKPADLHLGRQALSDLVASRQSRRKYAPEALTLEELSFLLWMTQGVHEVIGNGYATRRTVPSGGARHPFETYLAIQRVADLTVGLYRYLPLEHQLCSLYDDPQLPEKVADACNRQSFVKGAAVVFIWSVIPYRSEWRYSIISEKVIALDAGHMCQNLYLASEAIGAGTCAIAAYNQTKLDSLLAVDGKDEFAIYVAPVGKQPH